MTSNRDNMKQAMKELLGKVGVGSEDELEPSGEVETSQVQEQQQGRNVSGERRFPGGFIRHQEDSVMNEKSSDNSAFTSAYTPLPNDTLISLGTSVFGDIRTEGNAEVRGKLKGNLEASGNVRISGKVLGEVKGNAVELCACTIQGNIIASASLHIDTDTIVVGDIIAGDLITDGKVKGNMQIERSAAFQRNAVLAGNVTAAMVTMCEGAKVQGTVRITQDSETNSLFDQDLDI